MQTATIRKYDAEGNLVKKIQVVKYKGSYIQETDVPPRVRYKINFSFFRGALDKMSDVEATKALGFLRLQ